MSSDCSRSPRIMNPCEGCLMPSSAPPGSLDASRMVIRLPSICPSRMRNGRGQRPDARSDDIRGLLVHALRLPGAGERFEVATLVVHCVSCFWVCLDIRPNQTTVKFEPSASSALWPPISRSRLAPSAGPNPLRIGEICVYVRKASADVRRAQIDPRDEASATLVGITYTLVETPSLSAIRTQSIKDLACVFRARS